MKGLVLVLALHASGDRWFGADKLQHFFLSAFVQSVSYAALRTADVPHDRALVAASAMTLGVGVAKEVHDHRAGRAFSVRDLTWDAAGIGAATLVLSHAR